MAERKFEKITTEAGLSHNNVWYIMQDKEGFMWILTEGGLNRYDGYNFRIFENNPEDPDSPNPGVKYTALVKGLGMTPNALFRNDASDLVVPLESQLGGLTGTNRTILTPQVHSQAQENSQVINRIKELLIANPKENLFTQNGYAPANNLQYIPPPSFAPIANTIPNGTIDIIQPLNNKTVNLGSQLQFIVNGTNLSSISVYIKVTEGNWIELTAQGNNLNQITTITNIYKVGTYEFIALGNCTNGEPIFKEGKFTVTNCIDNYNPLVGEIINPYYQAKNKIVASGQLVFGQPVVMTAGQSIEFKPGFVADTYTTLEAKIKACDN